MSVFCRFVLFGFMSFDLLFFFSFFSLCSPSLSPLPSFPTRRSSDLDRVGRCHGASRSSRQRRQSSRCSSSSDRKSTRLNSSHLGISYAVFCLKKKKKKKKRKIK